jgi:chromosome segregation ATPase
MMTRAPIPPSQIAGALDFLNILRLVASNPEEIQGRLKELADAQAELSTRQDEVRAQLVELERKTSESDAAVGRADAAIAELATARGAAAADRERVMENLDDRIASTVAAEELILNKKAALDAGAADFAASCAARIEGINRREAELTESILKHAKRVDTELSEAAIIREAAASAAAAAYELRAEYESKLEKIQGLASTLSGSSA